MCGLVGFFAPTTTSDANIQNFINMLAVDQIRGMHATGVAKVNTKTNTVTMHKRADNAIDFLARQDTKDFLSKDRGNIYIGHNRFATMGGKDDHENAHPFQADHITLVHNGVVDSHALHLLTGMNRKDVNVDSHGVALTIAEHGVKKAVTEHLSGGFALVWYDTNERTLNFIRNPDRPLYIGVLQDGSMVWASELGMLDVFFKRPGGRMGYRMEPTLIEHSSHIKFKFNEHGYRIGNGPAVEGMQFLDLPYPKSQSGNNSHWWGSDYPGTGTTSQNSRGSNVANLNMSDESKQRLNAAEVRTAERVNGVLSFGRSPLRYKEIITLDIKERFEYSNNSGQSRVTGICRKSGALIEIWALSTDKLKGVTVLRALVDNAYHHTIRGVAGVTITATKASVSLLDPLAKTLTNPYFVTMYPSSEEYAEMDVARKKKEGVHPPVKQLTGNQGSGISYPLKVAGHTFMSREEMTDFTSQGCDTCGKIPTAYSRHNANMVVRAGAKFTGLLEECTFTCGECGDL